MRADLPILAILTRWVLLLALGVHLSLTGAGVLTLPALLAAAALWNLLLSVRWLRGEAWPQQAAIEIAVDFALALSLFYFSRTLLGPLAWVGVLPVASAAWAYGLGGGLAVALAVTAALAALAGIDLAWASIPVRLILPTLGFLLAGSLIGFLSRQLQFGFRQRIEVQQYRRLERARRERERTQAIYEITSALNSTLVFDQVLETALDLGCNALTEPHETVTRTQGGVLLFDEGGLRLAAARRLSAEDIGRILPGQEGALGDLVKSGEPHQVPMPMTDPEFKLLAGLQNAQSLYALPLVSGLDLFGVLFLAHPEAEFFTTERCDLVSIIARQVMVALQNAQLYESLTEEKERIAHIQEQARQQLARNLHDGPTQNVAAIAMRVNLARRLLAKDPAAAGDELYKIEDLSRRTTKEMRHMLFTLRPQALETEGLAVALRDLANHLKETYGLNIEVDVDAQAEKRMDRGKQGVLFFIAAEALSNANRHAKAENVTMRLIKGEANVTILDVKDDGVGFDAGNTPRPNGGDAHGLDVLRERVDLMNAIMRLDAAPGRGTRLRVWVPLTEQAADRLRRGEL